MHNIPCRFLKLSCLLCLQQIVLWQRTFQSVGVWCHLGPFFVCLVLVKYLTAVILILHEFEKYVVLLMVIDKHLVGIQNSLDKEPQGTFATFRSFMEFAYSVVDGPHGSLLP